MGKTNNPIIISNDLDQAPKTGENYQKTLDQLKPEIIKAMDRFITLDDNCDQNLINWIMETYKTQNESNKFPLNEITQLLGDHKCEKVSLQLKKEKVKTDGGWRRMIGAPTALDFNHDLGETYCKTGEEIINEGEIGTFLTFEYSDSGAYKVKVHQIERPSSALLMKGLQCHKDLTFDEFIEEMNKEEIMGKDNNEGEKDNDNINGKSDEKGNKSLKSKIKHLFK